MTITRHIAIDLVKKLVPPRVYVMQYDTNTRIVEIELTANGEKWTPPEGVSFALSYRKPDGKRGFYNKLSENVSAVTVEENKISVILAHQVLTTPGMVDAALVMNNADMERLASFPFEIHVVADPSAGTTQSDDYFNCGYVHKDAVLFSPQNLTPEEQAQAKANLGITEDAVNVFTPTAKVTQTASGAVITITDKDGTTSVNVANGKDGPAGPEGPQGLTGEAGSVGPQGPAGETGPVGPQGPQGALGPAGPEGPQGDVGPQGLQGPAGADGKTPVRGTDYWTEVDQETIVQQVIIALGTPVFGRVDENNNIILTGKLTDGTYVLKYEDADGNVTEIGTVQVGTAYDNLADQTSTDWMTDKRINSSGVLVDATGVDITNFIPLSAEAKKVHIKGLDIVSALSTGQNYGRIYGYDDSKNYLAYQTPSTLPNYFHIADYDSSVCIYDVEAARTNTNMDAFTSVRASYLRFGGIPASEKIIITIDQEIV